MNAYDLTDIDIERPTDFERRRHQRKHRDGDLVSLGSHDAKLVDLSIEGACISTTVGDAPVIGEMNELEFALNGERVRAMVLVRWRTKKADRELVGLQFVWVPEHMADTLRAAFSGRCAA